MNSSSISKCLAFIQAQERTRGPVPGEEHLPAITISREAGAGAHSVGDRVVQLLEEKRKKDHGGPWTLLDKELVEHVLEDHDLPQRIRRFMPEDVSPPLTDAVEEILGLHPSSWTLFEHTVDTICRLALLGNVVLIGRGSNIITAKMPHVFHVRLVAPVEARIRRFMERDKISEEEATKLVSKIDKARGRYVSSYFTQKVKDDLGYHITINTARTGYDKAAELIVSAIS